MQNYTHLTMRDRCLIATFLSMDAKIATIASRSGRHRSTIYREIKRNKVKDHYMPGIAHELAKQRYPGPSNKLQTNKELNEYVLKGLKNGWTPEQIAGRMKEQNKPFYVCAESIYRYIYRNKHLGLYKLLPSGKPKRRMRGARKPHLTKLQIAKRSIWLRPEEIGLRATIGHWEGDTIHFPKGQKTCVTTLVERKSRYVCLRKNKDKTTKTVMNHICNSIKLSPKKIWNSLTLDQGFEFMSFRTIERQTKCKIYFCDPHSPWQRGSNENTNGRLRRFLPKQFEIDRINQRTLDRIAIQVNNTPRKCLGYKTPKEVLIQHCRTAL